MSTAKNTILPFEEERLSKVHCGEDCLAGVVSILGRYNLRHYDGCRDGCYIVRPRYCGRFLVINENHFHLVTFNVVKSVLIIRGNVRLQVSSLSEVYCVELKVLFFEEVRFIARWIISCVLTAIVEPRSPGLSVQHPQAFLVACVRLRSLFLQHLGSHCHLKNSPVSFLS